MPSHTDPIAQLGKLEKAASEIKLQRQIRRAIASEIVPRATVAAALRELRARIAAESVSLTPENAAGYSRDIADAENATVELALHHVDATIAKLGLEEPK